MKGIVLVDTSVFLEILDVPIKANRSAEFRGRSPFTPTSSLEIGQIVRWLDEFPDRATQGVGIGDLSIIHEWERQRDIHAARRVLIWSLDQHLSS